MVIRSLKEAAFSEFLSIFRRSQFSFFHDKSVSQTNAPEWCREAPRNMVLFWLSLVTNLVAYSLFLAALLFIYPFVYVLFLVLLFPVWLLGPNGQENFNRNHRNVMNAVPRVLGRYERHCERQSEQFNFEMGKPCRLPLERKHSLGQSHHRLVPQTSSPLLTKLPAELRIQIYQYVIVGDSTHLHIIVQRNTHPTNERQRRKAKIHGYRCNRDFDAFYADEVESHARVYGILPYYGTLDKGRSRGPLNLIKACRQTYIEVIDLLYSVFWS